MLKNMGLQIKLTLAIGLIALLLGMAGYAWISNGEQRFVHEAEKLRSLQTGHALNESLKAIMLAGHGDIAHNWLQRLRHSPDVLDARVYRRNGSEAFIDTKTVEKVNRFLGEPRFPKRKVTEKKQPLPTWLAHDDFRQATGGAIAFKHLDNRETAILMPVRMEPACLRCHGYDQNPVRGVLLLRLPAEADAAGMASFFSHQMMILGLLALIFVASVYGWAHRLVARPVVDMARAADRITGAGDDARMPDDSRSDELGVLSQSINALLDKLAGCRHYERSLILLMLGHHKDLKALMLAIGEAARHLTGAPYAVVSYKEDGAPVFQTLGVDMDDMRRRGLQPPRGVGLLGKLWDTGELLRLDDIASHPSATGFPAGHPAMTSFLGSGIKADGEICGVLYLTRKAGVFSAEDEEIVRLLASTAAIAIERLRHIEALKSLNENLESHVLERTRELADANRRLRSREMDLDTLNHQLLAADRAKDEFIANASHELRTPLNAIIGFTELMRHPRYGALGDKQLSFLEKVANSSKRLVGIINDMLDISRIESGRMEVHEEVCRLGEIATQLEGELASLAVEKDVQFHVRTEEDVEINADAEKIRQIMINLLGNALKFTPPGGTVEGVLSISGDDLLGITSDTGIGIGGEDLERVFHPFEQVETGETRKYKGTGLGLALSRQMASLLGGSLSAISTPGKGSCFTLRIPVHRLKMHAATDQEDQPVMPAADAAPAVLVIDRDKHRQDAIVKVVEADGYIVYTTTMEEASAMVRGVAPFVVLYGEPGDPKRMLQEIAVLKRDDAIRDLPVVLVSGDAEQPRFSWGAVEFSGQDMDVDRLLDRISRYGQLLPLMRKAISVLVIDDDPDVHAFLHEVLSAHGYSMLSARTGDSGIRIAREFQPNVIILDLMLPMISGFSVMEALARDPNTTDIPVMIYSGRELSAMDINRLGTSPELVVTKGGKNGLEIVTQLRKMELLYPVQARLVDPVLGMKNSRYLRLRLLQEERRSKRHGQPFSVIGWCMDGFADYETAHGVRWATAALREMSELVRASLRLSDEAIRVSTNRFILLLPGLDQESAYRVAEKLRIKISHARWTLPGGERGGMTAAFAALGVMERETWRSKALLDILWRTLDQAMEKQNCTLMADEGGVDESADRG